MTYIIDKCGGEAVGRIFAEGYDVTATGLYKAGYNRTAWRKSSWE